jgi:hypothetical protein
LRRGISGQKILTCHRFICQMKAWFGSSRRSAPLRTSYPLGYCWRIPDESPQVTANPVLGDVDEQIDPRI